MGTKVVLCGHHWAGCRVLEHLMARGDISDLAVFGHGAKDAVPDVLSLARSKGIWCSAQSINESALPFTPDVIASVYYRTIIRAQVIKACEGAIFNMHPSLLPRHRGCSAVPWAIIEGDQTTGVTFHYVDEGIDTGRLILQAPLAIAADETQETLYQRCMEEGVRQWPVAFDRVKSRFPGTAQDGPSCYHRRGCPYGGEIDDAWPIEMIERFIRAMIYPPYPCATYKGTPVRSLEEYLRQSDSKRKSFEK